MRLSQTRSAGTAHPYGVSRPPLAGTFPLFGPGRDRT